MTLDQKNFDPFFDLVVVVLKPFNYLPWSSRPKKTFQHIFGLAPFGLKIFDLKIFGVEKFGLAAPSRYRGSDLNYFIKSDQGIISNTMQENTLC